MDHRVHCRLTRNPARRLSVALFEWLQQRRLSSASKDWNWVSLTFGLALRSRPFIPLILPFLLLLRLPLPPLLPRLHSSFSFFFSLLTFSTSNSSWLFAPNCSLIRSRLSIFHLAASPLQILPAFSHNCQNYGIYRDDWQNSWTQCVVHLRTLLIPPMARSSCLFRALLLLLVCRDNLFSHFPEIHREREGGTLKVHQKQFRLNTRTTRASARGNVHVRSMRNQMCPHTDLWNCKLAARYVNCNCVLQVMLINDRLFEADTFQRVAFRFDANGKQISSLLCASSFWVTRDLFFYGEY